MGDTKGVYPVDFFNYQQYDQSVWATLTYPFELMAPGMWVEGEPNNYGGANEQCVNGDGISMVTTGASMTSCAATNSTPSSASFPVNYEENSSPASQNKQKI